MKEDLLSQLTAISPVDGRYKNKTLSLSDFFSEFALMKERMKLEIEYLIFLSDKKIIRKISSEEKKELRNLYERFSLNEAVDIKENGRKILHDLKAVEYFLRNRLEKTSLMDLIEYIHFGLTSEDIKNISNRTLLMQANRELIIPQLELLVNVLKEKSKSYKNVVIIGRTHGQNAVPTTFGKEFLVFLDRINLQVNKLKKMEFYGKFGGAVGNFNSLYFVYPKINWQSFSKEFVSNFELNYLEHTTQTNPDDDIVEYFQIVQRINGVLNDLNQDMWRYISDTWFVQENNEGEIGSSTMPQKINPEDFETSEGNIAIANGLIEVFVRKLPVSRLQRDLSNSTVLRNTGVILAHSLIAYKATEKGLSRISPSPKLINFVNKDWSVLSEAAQTLLRKEGVKNPYQLLLNLTRGKILDEKGWKEIVSKLPISEDNKRKLSELTPEKYRGVY